MNASNNLVKTSRKRPTVSELDQEWETKQKRSRKAGKVQRGKARQNKRMFD